MSEETALQDLMALLKVPAGPGKEKIMVEYLTGLFKEWGIPENSWETDDAQNQSEYGGNSGNLNCDPQQSLPDRRPSPRP